MQHKIVVINGPNLNLLGQREEEIYGTTSLEEINQDLQRLAMEKGVDIEFFQSNHEGALVDRIHAARGEAHYLLINAGAYTHYSIALHDALKAVGIPFIEVHLTIPEAREPFRHHSFLSPIAAGKICGLGGLSYKLALLAACEALKGGKEEEYAG